MERTILLSISKFSRYKSENNFVRLLKLLFRIFKLVARMLKFFAALLELLLQAGKIYELFKYCIFLQNIH